MAGDGFSRCRCAIHLPPFKGRKTLQTRKEEHNMKRTREGFEKLVKGVRRSMPTRNNGRKVVVLSEYTKRGKAIIDSASHWEGDYLHQVYDRPSKAKQRAFDEVWEMYCNSENASAFGICSHNTFNFTVSWVVPGCIWFITSTTEYMVLCNE